MRGRVMALWALAWLGSTPIGGPIVGWVGQTAGARWGLVIGGLPTVVCGLAALPALGRIGRRADAAQAAEVAAAQAAAGEEAGPEAADIRPGPDGPPRDRPARERLGRHQPTPI